MSSPVAPGRGRARGVRGHHPARCELDRRSGPSAVNSGARHRSRLGPGVEFPRRRCRRAWCAGERGVRRGVAARAGARSRPEGTVVRFVTPAVAERTSRNWGRPDNAGTGTVVTAGEPRNPLRRGKIRPDRPGGAGGPPWRSRSRCRCPRGGCGVSSGPLSAAAEETPWVCTLARVRSWGCACRARVLRPAVQDTPALERFHAADAADPGERSSPDPAQRGPHGTEGGSGVAVRIRPPSLRAPRSALSRGSARRSA